MSTYIFLRHAHSAANESGLLTGRLPGIGLSIDGRRQATELVERIGKTSIEFLHISPIERCQLTIDPWLRSKYSKSLTSMEIRDGLSEIDFGRWSGRKLSALRRDPLWKDVQSQPSRVTFPGGESFKAAQSRAVSAFDDIKSIRGDKVHLIVSHSDTIKLIIAKTLSMKLDEFQKLEISPASFTIFSTSKHSISLETINNTGTLSDLLKRSR